MHCTGDTTFLAGIGDAAVRHPMRDAAALCADAAQVLGDTDRAPPTTVTVVVAGMDDAGLPLATVHLPGVALPTVEDTGEGVSVSLNLFRFL